jgi:hypothetical protein
MYHSRNIYREEATGPICASLRRCSASWPLFGIVNRILDAKSQFRSLAERWRHRHRHRAVDASGTQRLGGRGVRSYQYPRR